MLTEDGRDVDEAIEQLEAERDALREALSEIAEADEHGSVWMQEIARAALEHRP